MIIPRVSQANFNRMLQEPGKHSLGGGLMLRVRAPGKASYSMRFQRQEGRGESWDWGRDLQSLGIARLREGEGMDQRRREPGALGRSTADDVAQAVGDLSRAEPDVMRKLQADDGTAALRVRWIALTTSRATAGSRTRWSEIDRTAKVWTIPAEKMKGHPTLRVALSAQALAVLDIAVRRRTRSDCVFPGQRGVLLLEADGRRLENSGWSWLPAGRLHQT